MQDDPDVIDGITVDYFKKLFSAKESSRPLESILRALLLLL